MTEALGVTAAARLLNLCVRQVQRLCEHGEIKAKKIGHTWILDLDDVLMYERKPPGIKLGQKIKRGVV